MSCEGGGAGWYVLALALALPLACTPASPSADDAGPAQQIGATADVTPPDSESNMESPKRRVPQVSPVSSAGVRYEALSGGRGRGFDQNGGIIRAVDEASGEELWVLQVYRTSYDPQEERDVQDRYITRIELSPDGEHLLLEAEGRRRFSVRLEDREVAQLQ